jgi:hypothetical protein
MTFAHLATSRRRNAAYSSGVLPTGSDPSALSRSLNSGEPIILRTSALIFAMMSRGVLAGALRPFQATASNPFKPDSSSVGTSGKVGVRFKLVTASTRSFPPRISAIADVRPL